MGWDGGGGWVDGWRDAFRVLLNSRPHKMRGGVTICGGQKNKILPGTSMYHDDDALIESVPDCQVQVRNEYCLKFH